MQQEAESRFQEAQDEAKDLAVSASRDMEAKIQQAWAQAELKIAAAEEECNAKIQALRAEYVIPEHLSALDPFGPRLDLFASSFRSSFECVCVCCVRYNSKDSEHATHRESVSEEAERQLSELKEQHASEVGD